MTDSPLRNMAVITPPWPSVSECIFRVSLGVTVFCILVLPCVILRITAKEVKQLKLARHITMLREIHQLAWNITHKNCNKCIKFDRPLQNLMF